MLCNTLNDGLFFAFYILRGFWFAPKGKFHVSITVL